MTDISLIPPLMKTITKLLQIFILFALLIAAPAAFALPLSEVNIITLPASGDLVDGITKSIELHPFGKDLDEKVGIRFEISKMNLPEAPVFKDHLGVFLFDPTEAEKGDQFLGGKVAGDYFEIDAYRTGIYFVAIITAEGSITFPELSSNPTEGLPFTVSSDPIKTNAGGPLWDQHPFWIEARGATVLNAEKLDNGMYEVFSSGDKLTFQAQAEGPGNIKFISYTPFNQDGAEGSISIEVEDDGSPLDPPSSLSITGNQLSWTKPSTSFMAYLLYYRVQGETTWNGNDYKAPASPISVGGAPYKLPFENPNQVTYELSMTSFDAAGNESPKSEIVVYTAPEDSYDYEGRAKELSAEYEALYNNSPEPETRSSLTSNQGFSDIRSPLLAEAVAFLVDKNIIKGYPDGTFQPDRVINRAETLKILLEAKQIAVDQDSTKIFPDVDPNLWFAKYVNTAKKLGLIKGYPDGTYQPTQEVNRAEFIKIAMSLQANYEGNTNYQGLITQYSDLDSNQWYMPFLNFAFNQGFLDLSDRFKPTKGMTRGDAAMIIYRVLSS